MTETELTLAIDKLLKHETSQHVNITVAIMQAIKGADIFVHNGEFKNIQEVSWIDGTDEYEEYTVYIEPSN